MPGDSPLSSSPASHGPAEGVNRQRVERWYSQQVEWLRVFVFGLLRNSELVDDVLQSVFRKALEHGAGVDPLSVRAWLTRVAHNEAMLLKRKRGIDSRALQKIGEWQRESGSPDPTLEIIQQETAARVQDAVRRLPPEQRLVVEKRIHGEQTFAEIASELQVPLGTVLTRMRLALGKLKIGRASCRERV